MACLSQRVLNMAISADQFVFSLITLGSANPDETMSSAAWRLEQKGKFIGRLFRPLIDRLFWFDPDHCRTSYESEISNAAAVINSRPTGSY